MSNRQPNVQKVDVQPLDTFRALAKGVQRMIVRTRKFRINFWTGSVAGEETVTTVERTDARH
jgi:hypothetical protein